MEDRKKAVRGDLDEHFFHVNPAHHFERRLWSAIGLADVPEQDIPIAKDDPNSVFSRFRGLLAEIPLSDAKNTDDGVPREVLAALEAHSLMHHVIETALRLFVMLSQLELGQSPWIPLAQLPANFKFRRQVKSLLSGKSAAQTTVRVALPHFDQLNNVIGKDDALAHTRFMSQWLMFFAEVFDQDGYNAAQGHNQATHGMAAIARNEVKMTLVPDLLAHSAPTVDEMDSGFDLINAVSITYLAKVRSESKGGASGWSL